MKAGIHAQVVEAFDINDKANDVYQHNFSHRPYQVLSYGFSWMILYIYELWFLLGNSFVLLFIYFYIDPVYLFNFFIFIFCFFVFILGSGYNSL